MGTSRYTHDQKIAYLARYETALKAGKNGIQILQEIGIAAPVLKMWKDRFTANGNFICPGTSGASRKYGIEQQRLFWLANDKVVNKNWSIVRAAKKFGISASSYYRLVKDPPPRPANIDAEPVSVPKQTPAKMTPPPITPSQSVASRMVLAPGALHKITIHKGEKALTMELPQSEIKALVASLWE